MLLKIFKKVNTFNITSKYIRKNALQFIHLKNSSNDSKNGTNEEKMTTISIDTSGLMRLGPEEPKETKEERTAESKNNTKKTSIKKEPETELIEHIKAKITMGGGPITVAEYMKEVLTNPTSGFYMKKDVFGKEGDFITSPDISQMFGELIGIWCIFRWEQMGKPEKFKIIELGPGRGTLISDLLRATKRFESFASSLESVHLVEVSQALRKLQAEKLKCNMIATKENDDDDAYAISDINFSEIFWHQSIDNIEKTCPEIIIGHEFIDSLPVHHFVKIKNNEWRERLIDVAPDEDPYHFRFILSPSQTPASMILTKKRLSWLNLIEREKVKEIEIGGEMLALAVKLSQRITETSGISLLIDYGKDSYYNGSLQAICKHEFVDVLKDPGSADLSAFVDFEALRYAVKESKCDAVALGPVEQRHFLKKLGIDARFEMLIKKASDEQRKKLHSGYLRLLGSEETGQSNGMGKIYKAMAIIPKKSEIPLGFE